MRRAFFYGVLAIMALTSSPADADVEERKVVERCFLQTEITRADFQSVRSPGGANEKIKCLVSCSMQGLHWMKEDGSFDLDLIKSLFSPTTAAVIDDCATKINPEDGDCQRSYEFFRCIAVSDPEVFGKFLSTDIMKPYPGSRLPFLNES